MTSCALPIYCYNSGYLSDSGCYRLLNAKVISVTNNVQQRAARRLRSGKRALDCRRHGQFTMHKLTFDRWTADDQMGLLTTRHLYRTGISHNSRAQVRTGRDFLSDLAGETNINVLSCSSSRVVGLRSLNVEHRVGRNVGLTSHHHPRCTSY